MTILNKQQQENILHHLAYHQNKVVSATSIFELLLPTEIASNSSKLYTDFLHNIKHLIQQKFLICKQELSGYGVTNDYFIEISPQGLTYLEPDGGIQIDNAITVKLDNQTLQTLVNFHIDRSNVSEAEKSTLKGLLSKMGDAAIGKFTEKALEVAFSQNPQAMIHLLQQL